MSKEKFEKILERVENLIAENKDKHEFIERMKDKIEKAEKHLKKSKKEK